MEDFTLSLQEKVHAHTNDYLIIGPYDQPQPYILLFKAHDKHMLQNV